MTIAGLTRFKANAEIEPVNLDPGNSMKYLVSWEFGPLAVENKELMRLMRENVIRASWTNESGILKEERLHFWNK